MTYSYTGGFSGHRRVLLWGTRNIGVNGMSIAGHRSSSRNRDIHLYNPYESASGIFSLLDIFRKRVKKADIRPNYYAPITVHC